MHQEEINIQSLADRKDITIGYSDDDIVIVDSIQRFVEISAAHVSMNAIIFCLDGRAQGQMNGQPLLLQKNQVAIIPPNTTLTGLMISPDFNMKALFLTNSIIQSFLREKISVWNEVLYIHGLHVVTAEEEDMLLLNRFHDMLRLFICKQTDTPFRTDVIQSLLRSAMLSLCGSLRIVAPPVTDTGQNAGTSNAHFRRFLDLLHNSDHRYHTADYYAEQLFITPKYLSTVCKKHSGKTANEWIREQLLEDIRYYLRQTDLSIKQVSDRLGFANPSFFGKYVKEHFDMTPVQFRNHTN